MHWHNFTHDRRQGRCSVAHALSRKTKEEVYVYGLKPCHLTYPFLYTFFSQKKKKLIYLKQGKSNVKLVK